MGIPTVLIFKGGEIVDSPAFELMPGHCVIEARPRGADKGAALRRQLLANAAHLRAGTLIVPNAAVLIANGPNPENGKKFIEYLATAAVEQALGMNELIRLLAEDFAEKHHALFLGRGPMWPIAMEGALKLKEISYIHAEVYAAGELKHGPLALSDEDMPVIVVAPNNDLLDKLKSNMQVVRARGGQLYVFADKDTGLESEPGVKVIQMPHADRVIAPIVYTVPLQLLAYHATVLKGTDVDQPRNLAKSVTVE